MKRMKRMFAVVLAAALCMAPVSGGAMDFGGLFVNGESVHRQVKAVLENGRTLVPVRVIAEELDYEVEWDGDTNSVTVSDGQDVLKLTIDSQAYEWNGEPKTLDVPPRLIQDRTFVPVRLVAEQFGCTVDWDKDSGTIYIIKQPVKEEDIDLNLLVEYGIISKEDLNQGEYITTLEAITAINKLRNGGVIETDLEKWWYHGYTLAPLESIDDTTKKWLAQTGDYRGIIKPQELLKVNFEACLTNYEALVYITRIVGSNYGCTDYPKEFDFTETAQTYQVAFNKGLISEIDMTNAEKPITREEFYKLLYKSMFVKFTKGGYSPTKMRYIDTLLIESETV